MARLREIERTQQDTLIAEAIIRLRARALETGRLQRVAPATDAELAEAVWEMLGLRIPAVAVCPGHSSPWQAFCDAYFARSPIAVWKASRGFGGKTVTLAALALIEAMTLGIDVNILGGSGAQSMRVHEEMRRIWNLPSAPRDLLAEEPTLWTTRFRHGNVIRALLASQRSVRGSHPVRLHLDEVDEMPLEIFDAAMGQTMTQYGVAAQTVVSSTHQYADGTMTEVLKRAAEKGWIVHSWCYKETMEPHGWLLQSEVDRKRSEVTASMWQTEYDLQEPSPESRAIQPEKVAAMFQREVGEWRGGNNEYIELETPVAGARYAHGADWARSVDWTVIITLRTDCWPFRLVAFERLQRMPWPVMIQRLDDRIERYGQPALHDGTGLGDVVDGYLSQPAEAFLMVGRARTDLLSEYIAAIERGEIIAPYIISMEAEHRTASVEAIYGSEHLPDTISAGALAYRAARNSYGTGEGSGWVDAPNHSIA